jgi:hypothetical protein
MKPFGLQILYICFLSVYLSHEKTVLCFEILKSRFLIYLAFYLLDEKQDEGTQARIVVLLDNSSDEKALRLKRELEIKSAEAGLKHRKALFSILYLVRQFDLSQANQDVGLGVVLEEPSFTLAQEPSQIEVK